ncbi:MAG: hypothetical protein ABJC04_01450 [Verrucomicrobiota bacterium]
MKTSLELNKVVLLGRTLEEYSLCFALNLGDWKNKTVLDLASGVSSFCVEANEQGVEVIAFDPIYELSPHAIKERCEADLDFVAATIGNVVAYKWDFYQTPQRMREFRERAYRKFLPDYAGKKETRYVAGKLPRLPFRDGQFTLTLVSYFLFVYEEQFDYEFHRESLKEMMRVTSGEVRIYPTVNFKGERARFLEKMIRDDSFAQFEFEEIATGFEFLRNSNFFLRVRRKI